MWKTKEEHRCQKLMGIKLKGARLRKETRKRCRQQDIRVTFRRAALKAARRGNHEQTQNIDTTPCNILLNDYNTSPLMANKRLQRLNTVRAIKTRWKIKHRRVPSLDQEYFSRTRHHSYQILKKITGKGHEHWRTVRTGTYNQLKDMEWLDEAVAEDAHGERVAVATVTSSNCVTNIYDANPTSRCNAVDQATNCLFSVKKIASSRLGIG